MSERKVIGWFTANGKHIPIFEGQTKDDALKAYAKGGVYKKVVDVKNSSIREHSKEDIMTTKGKSSSNYIFQNEQLKAKQIANAKAEADRLNKKKRG